MAENTTSPNNLCAQPTYVEAVTQTQNQNSRKDDAESKPNGCIPNNQSLIESKLSKLKIDPEVFKSNLKKAKEVTVKSMEASLLGFLIGEPMEFTKLRAKLRNRWRNFVGLDFLIINRQNYWFEIKFKTPKDRKKIWEARPYHIVGQLLVLREWRPDFNPSKEFKSRVDLWFRLPKLSPLYLTNEALPHILEANGLGELIRFETTHNQVCANVDIEDIMMESIIAPDENGEFTEIGIWFENNQKGCGFCGDKDHLFHQCEQKKAASLPTQEFPKKHGKKRGDRAAGQGPSNDSGTIPSGVEVGVQRPASPTPCAAGIRNAPAVEADYADGKIEHQNGKISDNPPVMGNTSSAKDNPEKKGDNFSGGEFVDASENQIGQKDGSEDYDSAPLGNSLKVSNSFKNHVLNMSKSGDDMETSETSRKRRTDNVGDTATSAPKGPRKRRFL